MATDHTLTPRRVEMTLEKFKRHARGRTNVHTDYEIAREYGYRAPPASGIMMMGYLSEWLFDTYGDPWLADGEISCKFFDIVIPGDTLVLDGDVTEGESEIEIDLGCYVERDGDTEDVFVGTASIGAD